MNLKANMGFFGNLEKNNYFCPMEQNLLQTKIAYLKGCGSGEIEI